MKLNGNQTKAYLLCFSCLFSRAINLIVCKDLTLEPFLRAFQLHSYSFGIPELCYSDMGSQLVAGSNVISDFISDPQTTAFFREKNINPLSFKQFPKGRKELGGIVESAVKAVKKLIYSSIRKTVLQFEDFELLVAETINIVNKRPVHIKEALRDSSNTEPFALTPELIVRGYELPNMNLIPDLQPVLEDP